MEKIKKEEAINRLKTHNPNIILIGEFVGLDNKTYFKCRNCDNVRLTSFENLLASVRKLGCIKCEKRKKNKKGRFKSHEQYLMEIHIVWGDLVKIIGQYYGGAKKIKTKCCVCNHIWNPEAKALLNKHGCPICGHKKNRMSTVKKHSEYVNEVRTVHGDKLCVKGVYVSNKDRILIKCNVCQHEWFPNARSITRGRGCPKCNLNKGETLINEILEELDVNFKQQYVIENLKTPKNGVPIFDFAIFNENDELKIIIEYDGIQHFEPIKAWGGRERLIKQQKVDKFKDEYLQKKGIRLIRIKYTELNNINCNYIKEKLYE